MKKQALGMELQTLGMAVGLLCSGLAWGQPVERSLAETTVIGTAEETLKQAPGVSVITAEDIERRPPSNDLSEIIRTMPGVNLTGNSTSGQRGNNRQIDLRGMGPENTLILIDGKPATSRNSVRMGWRGERDSRGDSNWVPAEQVERIEVIRGPAAARYGNGAAGGVVNIITKKAGKELHGQVTVYANAPEHGEEGATRRTNFSLSGPVADNLTFRLNGNATNTEVDGRYINNGHQAPGFASSMPAGREGLRNRDISGQLSWNLLPGHTVNLDLSYSRQGNLYAGDTQNVTSNSVVEQMYGKETNVIERRNFALTHKGKHDFGSSTTYLQYTETDNTRLQEGLVGGTEGIFLTGSPPFVTNKLEDVTFHSEVSLPIRGTLNHMLTTGVEWAGQKLKDPTSNTQATTFGAIPGVSSTGRSPEASAQIVSLFAEDNIELSPKTVLTPGMRFDSHTQSGVNWSPALNVTHMLTEKVSLKGGIARSYKAPNLYQSNSNYLLYSSSNGCLNATGGCYLIGNANLKAETSINKELGIEYKDEGLAAGLTWFHNDYRDKIQAGTSPIGYTGTRAIYQWANIPEAVVQGLEGNLRLPLKSNLNWITNFTYMIESKNKTTGDYLSIIPEYTVNTSLDWRVDQQLSALFSVTLYGEQKAMKLDYQGNPVTGSSADSLAPYAIANLSGTYALSKDTKFTVGVNNLFDKRLFRAGNAVSVASTAVYGTSGGAGAATYNETGRTLYVSLSTAF